MAIKDKENMPKEIHTLTAKAVKYLNSEKGQEEIKNALEKSSKIAKELQKERKIDPSELHDPMTI